VRSAHAVYVSAEEVKARCGGSPTFAFYFRIFLFMKYTRQRLPDGDIIVPRGVERLPGAASQSADAPCALAPCLFVGV